MTDVDFRKPAGYKNINHSGTYVPPVTLTNKNPNKNPNKNNKNYRQKDKELY